MSQPLGPGPYIYDAPPANPRPGGLYGAASVEVLSGASRHAGGIAVVDINAGGHGRWVLDCDPAENPDPKGGDRGGDGLVFPGIGVWAVDDCTLVGTAGASPEERARQLLRIIEQVEVETHVAELLQARATASPAALAGVTGLVAQVSRLDAELSAWGVQGVVHAAAGMAAPLKAADMVVVDGRRLLTPAGHLWAFGGGYAPLGATLYGTGPVAVRQSEVLAQGPGYDLPRNERLWVAERIVTAAWEIGAVSAAPAV